MDNMYGFNRIFLIFNQEDPGYEYGNGQKPAGYVKIEVRDGKGKLSAFVQNLKDNRDISGSDYKAYLLNNLENEVLEVCAGTIAVQGGKGELKWEFDPRNVAMTGHDINDFAAAAVVVEDKNRDNGEVICPLAAYKDRKMKWRDGFRKEQRTIKPVFEETEDELIKKGDDLIPRPFENVFPMENANNTMGFNPETEANSEAGIAPKTETHPGAENTERTNDGAETGTANCIYAANKNSSCGNAGGFDACKNCCWYGGIKSVNKVEAGVLSIDKLIESFGIYFEKSNPFNSRRSDYKWWKVGNPVYLNNILYQYGIRTPLLYNPAVMTAHFKYKHLIAGIFSDKLRGREYIVCGIPGAWKVDERPLGDICRWVQLEGCRSKPGTFGYWLVYIDTKTGKFINLA